MNKSNGQNLIEFLLILSLISIGSIIVLSLLGDTVSNLFNESSQKVKNYDPFGSSKYASANAANPPSVAPPVLPDPYEVPITTCSGGICSIDYGNLILSGIPENFGEFVKTSGSAGGSDMLAKLFNNIAQSEKEAGNSQLAQDLEDMGNLIAFMSQIQGKYEDTADGCSGYNRSGEPRGGTTVGHCFFYSRFDQPLGLTLPDNLATVIPDYNVNNTIGGAEGINNIAYYKYLMANNPSWVGTAVTSNPGAALAKKFDDFYNNASYPAGIKKIVKELYVSTNQIAARQEGSLNSAFGNDGSMTPFYMYDPVTGEKPSRVVNMSTGTLTIPNPPDYADLKAALGAVNNK